MNFEATLDDYQAPAVSWGAQLVYIGDKDYMD